MSQPRVFWNREDSEGDEGEDNEPLIGITDFITTVIVLTLVLVTALIFLPLFKCILAGNLTLARC
jgi:hypothetical protein